MQEKAEFVERMYKKGEKTKYIAELINISTRSVQDYVNKHHNLYDGEPWKKLSQKSQIGKQKSALNK